MNNPLKNAAVWITVGAALVFAAAFMPWGDIQGSPSFDGPMGNMFGSSPFGGMTLTITVTGWNGTINLVGVKLPNWTVVLLAMAVAAIAWLAVSNTWQPPRFLGLALALAGLLQVVLTLIVFVGSDKATIGIGILATIVAFAILAYFSFVLSKRPPVVALT